MSEENLFPGIMLIAKITEKAEKLGLDRYQLADELGMSYNYLRVLSTGARPLSGLGNASMKRIAEFLDIPVVQAMVMAENLTVRDFMSPDAKVLERQIQRGYEQLQNDMVWGTMCPSIKDWSGFSDTTKLLLITLYERVSGMELIEKARTQQLLSQDAPDPLATAAPKALDQLPSETSEAEAETPPKKITPTSQKKSSTAKAKAADAEDEKEKPAARGKSRQSARRSSATA